MKGALKKYKIDKNKVLIFAIIFFLTIFSVMISGFFYNEELDYRVGIPFIKKLQDPSLYPGDLYMEQFPYYYSFFWIVISPLTEIFDQQILFFFLYFLLEYFILIMIFYLAKLLFNDYRVSFLSVLLIMITKPGLGISTGFPILAPRLLGLLLLLISIYLFIKKRYISALLVNGFALNFHVTSAAPIFAVYLFYFLVNFKKLGLKRIFSPILSFFVAAIPILIWKFLYRLPANPFIAHERWLELLYISSPWHLFASTWPFGKWVRFLAFFILILISLKFIPKNKDYHRTMMIFGIGFILINISAFIFSEIIPVSLLIALQMFRSAKWILILGMIYVSNYIIRSTEIENDLISLFSYYGIAVAVFLSNFKAVIVFLLFIYIKNIKSRVIKISLLIIPAILLFISIFTSYSLPSFLTFLKFGPLPSVIILLSSISIIIIYFMKNNLSKRMLNNVSIFLIIAILIITSLGMINIRAVADRPDTQFAELSMEIINEPFNPIGVEGARQLINNPIGLFNNNVQAFIKIPSNGWQDVQLWAKNNIPKEKKLITPPYLQGFKVFSERAIVTDCFDGAPLLPNAAYGYEWLPVIEDICNHKYGVGCHKFCKESYNKLDESYFIGLGERYDAEYVVIENQNKLNFTLLYENSEFSLYSIK